MNLDFGRLSIDRVIIHEIPWHIRKDSEGSPLLSEVDSPLTDELKRFLREKIIGSAGSSDATRVIFLEASASPIPRWIQKYFDPETPVDYIKMSQETAKYLYEIQAGLNPTGLLAVLACTISDYSALGLLKIEKEEGIRLREREIGGKKTFDLEHIRELMLTRKTKLFKIGMFISENGGPDSIYGLVCDYQKGIPSTKKVADFFLSKFLGCRLSAEPPVMTRDFFEATQDFIELQIEDPIEKSRCCSHIVSELTNNRQTVRPRTVAHDYFPLDLQRAYLEHLESRGIPPNQFDKDTSLVDRRLRKIFLEFAHGVQILAPAETYEESVTLERVDEENTRAEIIGKIKSVRSK